ncbi:hypothetical protein B296_00046191, partial [Ensete ventricosum]
KERGGGAASHGQPPCRAGHPWPGRGQGQLAREAGVTRGGSSRLRPAHRGGSRSRAHMLTALRSQRGPATGRPQGATASRGNDTDRWGSHPIAGWLPTGKGNRRPRRGSNSDDDDGVDGARGVRASF